MGALVSVRPTAGGGMPGVNSGDQRKRLESRSDADPPEPAARAGPRGGVRRLLTRTASTSASHSASLESGYGAAAGLHTRYRPDRGAVDGPHAAGGGFCGCSRSRLEGSVMTGAGTGRAGAQTTDPSTCTGSRRRSGRVRVRSALKTFALIATVHPGHATAGCRAHANKRTHRRLLPFGAGLAGRRQPFAAGYCPNV